MAKESGGSSAGGGRRGAQVKADMSMGKAKSLQTKSKSKPDLNKSLPVKKGK